MVVWAMPTNFVNSVTLYSCDDVEHVVIKERSRLRDQIDISGFWQTLGKLGATKRFSDDPKCLDLLFYRLALHFNGENWYDAHPLVAELPDYEMAVLNAQTEPGKRVT